MGLRPTHRDESALLTHRLIPNGLCSDFRRSVIGLWVLKKSVFRKNVYPEVRTSLAGLPNAKFFGELFLQ